MIEVTTEKFSGPLGLLLSLIESEEMDITDISLAKIADEYVKRLRAADNIGPEEMADFLVVAAKLLYIKSKALLPYLYTDEEEEPADDLERQLRMYKEFVSASEKVKGIIQAGRWLFVPSFSKSRRPQFNLPAFSPPSKITVAVLHDKFSAFVALLEKSREKPLEERSLEAQVNIEEKIGIIKKMIINQAKVNFSRLLASAASRTEVIVSFLALLELAKQREILFEQTELFSDIHISRGNGNTTTL